MLAWGQKVSPIFRDLVIQYCSQLAMNPDYLMTVMAFETGRTFSPRITNQAGSGAIGLIQFMPSTAHALGTSTEELAKMEAEDQLWYVYQYFKRSKGKIKSLSDAYLTVLYPAAVGKDENAVVFDSKHPRYPKLYLQNKGLDANKDGVILKSEIVAMVKPLLAEGLKYSA